MIAYCRKRQPSVQRVLIWKVDRLARNVGDHFNIKASLLKHDVRVVSVTEPIDANPEGKLLETILAGFAQFDNDIRAARTLQGMRHKIQEGLFPWKAPIGYRSGCSSKHGGSWRRVPLPRPRYAKCSQVEECGQGAASRYPPRTLIGYSVTHFMRGLFAIRGPARSTKGGTSQ